MSRAPWHRGNTFAVTLALAACLACVALACSAPLLFAAADLRTHPAGLDVVPLCAWVRGSRAGLWWNTAITPRASVAVAGPFNAVCVAAPWLPGLPERGRPSFDFLP